jgi:hypothetical protein
MQKITLLFIALFTLSSAAFAQTAKVQIIHNSADPAAAEVDIYVNGNILLDNFAFREATGFVDVPAGVILNIQVAPPNSTSSAQAIATFPFTLADGENYYVVANGVLNPGSFASNPDAAGTAFNLFAYPGAQLSSTSASEFQVQFFHGATDVPTVDVVARNLGNIVAINNSSYSNYNGTSYLGLPLQNLILDVTPGSDNSNILLTYQVNTSGLGGLSGLIFASGFLDPTANQNGEGFGVFVALANGTVVELEQTSLARLQVIHNSADPGAAQVDVYVNDDLLIDNFAFRAATPFIDVPADALLNIQIAPPTSTSSAQAIATFPVTLQNGKTYIVFANGVLAPGSFASNPDAVSTAFSLYPVADAKESSTANDVSILAFHGCTDAPTVDVKLKNGAVLFDDLEYTEASSYLTVPASNYILEVTPGNNNSSVLVSYEANVSSIGGSAITVFASGFLTPTANQNGAAFGLWVALADGTTFPLPVVCNTCSEPAGQSTSNITATTAKVNWNNPNCTQRFRLQYRVVGSTNWITRFTSNTTFTLKNLTPSTNYQYRLRSVCSSNGTYVSNWTSIGTFTTTSQGATNRFEEMEVTEMQLFPNPAQSVLNIAVQSTFENNSVEIYNAIGQVVYTQLNISDRTVSVDINSLPKGLYIVRYTDNNGIVNRNFIKN